MIHKSSFVKIINFNEMKGQKIILINSEMTSAKNESSLNENHLKYLLIANPNEIAHMKNFGQIQFSRGCWNFFNLKWNKSLKTDAIHLFMYTNIMVKKFSCNFKTVRIGLIYLFDVSLHRIISYCLRWPPYLAVNILWWITKFFIATFGQIANGQTSNKGENVKNWTETETDTKAPLNRSFAALAALFLSHNHYQYHYRYYYRYIIHIKLKELHKK